MRFWNVAHGEAPLEWLPQRRSQQKETKPKAVPKAVPELQEHKTQAVGKKKEKSKSWIVVQIKLGGGNKQLKGDENRNFVCQKITKYF